MRRLVDGEDRCIKPHQEEIEIINLGTEEEKQEIKIGTTMSDDERRKLIALLHEFKEVFAWSYKDMPGLDPNIVVHQIPLMSGCKPVKH